MVIPTDSLDLNFISILVQVTPAKIMIIFNIRKFCELFLYKVLKMGANRCGWLPSQKGTLTRGQTSPFGTGDWYLFQGLPVVRHASFFKNSP